MGFEKELERVLSRRKFLAGLGLTVGSVSLAKLALLQTKATELARQADQAEGVTGFGSGPGDADSFARLLSPIGASATYLRSNGSSPAWANILAGDLPAPKIERTGSFTTSIAANAQSSGVVNATISPSLSDTTSFRAWAQARQSTVPAPGFVASCRISSISNLQIIVFRAATPSNFNVHTAHLAVWPSDIQEDGGPGVGHQHASDAVGSVDYAHNLHSLVITAASPIVDWWISSLAD